MRAALGVVFLALACGGSPARGPTPDPATTMPPAATTAAPPEGTGSTSGPGGSSESDADESESSGAIEAGSSSGEIEPPACLDYDSEAEFVDFASFAADIVPIFQQHCNSDACHSSLGATPAAGLRLGLPLGTTMTPAQIAGVHAAIVGVSALRAEMDLVASGDPARSFLLVKTEYAAPADCDEVVCKPGGCGIRMPAADDAGLTQAELAALRTWIRDGASP